MDLERFRLLPLEPPAVLATEYERPCIMTAFMPLAMEKDLRWDLMATGSGSLSMRWTGVQDTMALQQRSCRLKTEERKRNVREARSASDPPSETRPLQGSRIEAYIDLE